jgi:outer membrane lipoprotein SlyB
VTASGVTVPPDHRYERYNASTGSYSPVDAKDVPKLVEQKAWIYDRTDKVWVQDKTGFNPRYAAGAAASGWQNIHGQVQSVSGSNLTLKADDGRTLTVDMNKVGSNIQQALKPGMAVTATGHEWSGPNQFRAEFIQQDSSASAQPSASAGAQPSASPSAAVDDQSWQRIHGTVSSVSGSQLTYKADDGRTLAVDMNEVNPDIQKSLTPGEAATVVGFYRGGNTNVAAKFIQKDSSNK